MLACVPAHLPASASPDLSAPDLPITAPACSGDSAEEAAAWEAAWRSPSWLRALALFFDGALRLLYALVDALNFGVKACEAFVIQLLYKAEGSGKGVV